MKFLIQKLFSLMLLALLIAGNIQADRCAQKDEECCRNSCYECSCNPLYCGAFDLQFQAGVAPILWANRGELDFIQCGGVSPANPIDKLFNIPKFSKFYHVPWIIGGQIGYAVSDNVRFYLEFNYLQASSKKNVAINTIGVSPNTIVFSNNKYKLFDVYVGARYYWDRWCDKLSVFVGVKAGLTQHKRTKFSSTITPPVPAVALTSDLTLFNRKTVPSGGLDIGLDYCICGNWALVLTAEMVASCGPKGAGNIPFGQPSATCGTIGFQPSLPQPISGVNNLLVGGIGTEIRFPITAAVRYVW